MVETVSPHKSAFFLMDGISLVLSVPLCYCYTGVHAYHDLPYNSAVRYYGEVLSCCGFESPLQTSGNLSLSLPYSLASVGTIESPDIMQIKKKRACVSLYTPPLLLLLSGSMKTF